MSAGIVSFEDLRNKFNLLEAVDTLINKYESNSYVKEYYNKSLKEKDFHKDVMNLEKLYRDSLRGTPVEIKDMYDMVIDMQLQLDKMQYKQEYPFKSSFESFRDNFNSYARDISGVLSEYCSSVKVNVGNALSKVRYKAQDACIGFDKKLLKAVIRANERHIRACDKSIDKYFRLIEKIAIKAVDVDTYEDKYEKISSVLQEKSDNKERCEKIVDAAYAKLKAYEDGERDAPNPFISTVDYVDSLAFKAVDSVGFNLSNYSDYNSYEQRLLSNHFDDKLLDGKLVFDSIQGTMDIDSLSDEQQVKLFEYLYYGECLTILKNERNHYDISFDYKHNSIVETIIMNDYLKYCKSDYGKALGHIFNNFEPIVIDLVNRDYQIIRNSFDESKSEFNILKNNILISKGLRNKDKFDKLLEPVSAVEKVVNTNKLSTTKKDVLVSSIIDVNSRVNNLKSVMVK